MSLSLALTLSLGSVASSAAAPTVIGATPNGGPRRATSGVVIAGTGFVSGCTVAIGGVSCTSVTFTNSTSLTVTTGVFLSDGAKDVVVTNPDAQTGTGVGAYTVLADPYDLTSATVKGQYKSDVGYGAGSWLDQSAKANNLTLTGTSAGATLNGRATVAFAAAGPGMANKVGFDLDSSGDITIAGVVKYTAAASYPTAFCFLDGANDTVGLCTNNATTTVATRDAVSINVGSTDMLNSWKRAVLTAATGGNLVLYLNNAAAELTNAVAVGTAIADGNSFCLGSLAGIQGYTGLIAEVVVFDAVLSAGDRALLDNYFKAKWGL